MSACKIYQLTEEQQYPKLFEWKNIKECNDQSLMEVATVLCQLIVKFNGVSRSLCKLMNERQKFEDKISYLTNQCKKLEDCENCVRLQNSLESNNLKIQTLADVFGQVFNKDKTLEKLRTSDKSDIDKVHDIFTQMVDGFKCDKTNTRNSIYGKRKLSASPTKKTNDPTLKEECDGFGSPLKKTRQRNVTPQKTPEATLDKVAEESISSPILGRGKQNRSFSIQDKLPLVNLSNRIDELTKTFGLISPKKEISSAEKKPTSPSLLRHPPTDEEKTPSPQHMLKSESLTAENLGNNENKRSSLSLLQNLNKKNTKNDCEEVSVKQSKSKVKKSPKKHKKFKQAQLSFSAAKNKKPLDITSVDSFCGGLRQFPAESFITKDNEDEMLKIALKLSLNENFQKTNAEDEDIINASPSNQPTHKQKKHKVQVHRRATPTKVSKNEDRVVVPDDEETMVFTTHIDNHKVPSTRSNNNSHRLHGKTAPSSSTIGEKQNNNTTVQSLSPSKIGKKVPVSKGIEPDFVYLEPVIRKKAEKKNLPGWSCKKCKDFYEVAFEGDDEMIRQKMNECSRHRGNFNPERMDTPAGFWDLKMPPTQDTEAFNKRNNRT